MPQRKHTDEELIRLWEELYQITLTDDERGWLLTSDSLLIPIDRQRRYLLKMHLTPIACPACSAQICVRSAGGYDDMRGSRPDDSYECNFCHAKLTWSLSPFGGGQSFRLNPGQKITT